MVWPFDDGLLDTAYERSDELDAILNSDTASPEARQMARGIDRDLNRVVNAGLDPSLSEPRSSFFSNLLDTLDAPRQGVAGVADTLMRGDAFTGDVGFGWSRGQEENTTFSDILRRHDIIDNPIARGVVGLAGDIVMDPLSYLSLGTGTAAKIGGRTLTEAGLALKTTGVQRLTDLGVTDLIQQEGILDEVFRGIHRGQDALKGIDSASGADAALALQSKRLDDAKDLYSAIFKDDEVLKADIFARPKLNIGINLPFVGHLTEDDLAQEIVTKSPGIVGQSLRALGKALKPGKVKLAELEFSDETLNAFKSIEDYATARLGQLGSEIASLPVVGGIAAATGDKAKQVYTAATEALQNTFYRKGLIGATNNQILEEYQNAVAGAKNIARDRALEIIGPENLKNIDDLKDAWLMIDELGAKAAQRGKIDPSLAEQIMRKQSLGQDIADGDLAMLRTGFMQPMENGFTPELAFRKELEERLSDPSLRPGVKDATVRLIKAFDDVQLQELEAGIDHGFLEYYVTHKYKDADRNPFASKAAPGNSTNFTKERKYQTLSDAFTIGGKVADTDVPSLLEYRINKSLTLQAQRSFAHRLMLENSIPEHLVKAAYQEALIDPTGPAAMALRRGRWDFKPLDIELQKEGVVNTERAKLLAKEGKDLTAEERRLVEMSNADFADQTHKTLWANGLRPKDYLMPDAKLGEIGTMVDIPGGGKAFMPTPVANAYKETIAARDLFKDKFGDTAVGRAFVKAVDHTSSWFKKFTTLPFPAYWAQNLIGDRFRQMTQGLHAMDAGVHARAYSVLNGESAIRNKAGQVLDKPTLERILKENGMNYNMSDYLGTIESFGDMNVDRFLRTKKSMLSNLFTTAKGSKGALLTQTHDKFQKSFDGFFRVTEMIRRFEKGDGILDAVRGANEMYFNYRAMTPVEQSFLRRFYMFYGYMSKATRATMTDLVTNPGNLTSQLHAVRGMAEFFSDPEAAPTAEMADLKLLNSTATAEQLSHPVGTSPDGNPIMGMGFAAPLNAVMQQFSVQVPRNFTVGEIVGTALTSAKRTVQKQFATANPMINVAAQAISGKNLYFDKPLDSAFLRKLPSLNEAAVKYAGFSYDSLPLDLDAPAKAFLKAVPDGKGRLIADPGRMFILMNIVPGLSRATSMAGTFTNADVPTKAALLRGMMGVRLQDTDVSRTYLSTQRDELNKFMQANSVKQRLDNMKAED